MGTLTESSHRGGSNNLKESRESLADGKKCEYTGRGSIQSNQRSNDTLNSLEMKLTLAQDRIEEADKATGSMADFLVAATTRRVESTQEYQYIYMQRYIYKEIENICGVLSDPLQNRL
ncbi:MAG: hypothetical protein ACI8RD_003343 [Bacillariaceae sp.]|jgi:hypothetical protein